MSYRAWLEYLCAMQGHVQNGVATNTSASGVVWSTHCWRCGARLIPAPVSPPDEEWEAFVADTTEAG